MNPKRTKGNEDELNRANNANGAGQGWGHPKNSKTLIEGTDQTRKDVLFLFFFTQCNNETLRIRGKLVSKRNHWWDKVVTIWTHRVTRKSFYEITRALAKALMRMRAAFIKEILEFADSSLTHRSRSTSSPLDVFSCLDKQQNNKKKIKQRNGARAIATWANLRVSRSVGIEARWTGLPGLNASRICQKRPDAKTADD